MTLTPQQTEEIAHLRSQSYPTRRATVPALEEVLYEAFPVLDHGFLRAIDYMGDDASVVQSARVSYGRGTKKVSEDAGLIRYLMRHHHSTPFEMCLDGDTRVQTFPCAGAKVKHYTMRQLAEAFEQGGKANSWVKLLGIRTVDPDTGMVLRTKIKHAWKTGTKAAYKVTVGSMSREVVATDNHPFLCADGKFRPLSDLAVGTEVCLNGIPATPGEVRGQIIHMRSQGNTQVHIAACLGLAQTTVSKILKEIGYVRKVPHRSGFLRKPIGSHVNPRKFSQAKVPKGPCSLCDKPGTDVHHIDQNPHNNVDENLIRLCSKHHRHVHTFGLLKKVVTAPITAIEPVGQRDVYDLETESEHHCFVAEGFVVHNCNIKYHVKLPIFVARQWIRHRTASVNEYSARYSILDKEFYIPAPEHLAAQSKDNRQGRGDVLEGEEAARVLDLLREDAERAYGHYEEMLEPDTNLARELARMNLSLNYYTQWYWSVNLNNKMNFLRLRADSHAQYEIRVYAQVMQDLLERWVPLTAEAFKEYRQGGAHLSASGLNVVRQMLAGENVTQDSSGMSKREWRELMDQIGRGL